MISFCLPYGWGNGAPWSWGAEFQKSSLSIGGVNRFIKIDFWGNPPVGNPRAPWGDEKYHASISDTCSRSIVAPERHLLSRQMFPRHFFLHRITKNQLEKYWT
jgi:hypothetical protein